MSKEYVHMTQMYTIWNTVVQQGKNVVGTACGILRTTFVRTNLSFIKKKKKKQRAIYKLSEVYYLKYFFSSSKLRSAT